MLKIGEISNRFIAVGEPDELLALKAKGWLYLSKRGEARTSKIERVVPFVEACTGSAFEKVKSYLDNRAAAVADSVAASVDINVPAPEGLEYRDYQKAGIAFMAARWGSLNADVPRLGKTIQTLGVVNLLPVVKKRRRVLAVVPANAKIGWKREAEKWLVHDMSVGYCEGDHNPDTDFLIINFEILIRHYDYLCSIEWDVVISDETHKLGNPKSNRTKIVFGKQLKGKKRDQKIGARHHFICLTGTPVFTRPSQLFPMIERLDKEGLGSNWYSFIYKYCGAKKTPFGLDYTGSSNEEELQFEMRKSFMVRREKNDVIDEIPPLRETVYLPKAGLTRLLATERSAFQNNLDKLIGMLNEGNDEQLTAVTMDDIGMVENKGAEARKELALRKVDMVIDFIEDLLLSEKKVIVFYHHREPLEKFYNHFDPKIIARVYGGMTTKTREAERVRFQEDDECRIIVGNLQSMSEAIELSASDVVVFAEFARAVPSEYDQAEERPWLPTKTTPIASYRLVIEDSIESDLVDVLTERQERIDRIMGQRFL